LLRLPRMMVPAILVTMDEFPRTASLKVDRRALPTPALVPEQRSSEPASELRASQTATEEAVLQIWRTVFRNRMLALDDVFIEAGGDSLLAVQCVNRVSDTFGVDLPVIMPFMQAPTARRMAHLIDEWLQADAAHAAHHS
jgi:surfactin family lipopeptide synthetase C